MTNIMARYLIKYGKLGLFAFHWFVKEFASVSLKLCNVWTAYDLMTYPFGSSTYPSTHTPKTSTVNYLLITYTLSLCPN